MTGALSSNGTPTEKQYRKLAVLGATAIALAPGRGEWGPLLRRGWVETIHEDDKDKRFLPPVRITVEGLHALARGMEKHDAAPEIRAEMPRQVDEPPAITKLKAQLAEAREAQQRAEHEAHQAIMKLRKAKRVLEGVDHSW